MKRTVWLIGILVVLCGVAAFTWRSGEEQSDVAIESKKESYTCKKCGEVFEMTLAQSRAAHASGAGVVCPKCHDSETEKNDVKVSISGFGSQKQDEPEQPEEEPPPASSVGGLRRVP